MTEFIHTWFNSGIVSYLLVMLTLFILWMMILGGIRILIETSLPKAMVEILKNYLAIKNAAEVARKKLEKNDNQ
mgnify:CR=1 FL=1